MHFENDVGREVAPADELLLCFAKEVTKKGDPTSAPLRGALATVRRAAVVANSAFSLKQRQPTPPHSKPTLGAVDGTGSLNVAFSSLTLLLDLLRAAVRDGGNSGFSRLPDRPSSRG